MRFLLQMDWDLLTWLQAHRTDALDQAMRYATYLGDRWILMGVAAAFLTVLLVQRRWREVVAVVAVLIGTVVMVEGIKPVIRRERPVVVNPAVPRSDSFSFPSGHAFSSAAIYGVMALILARRLTSTWQRAALLGGALLLVLVVGFSRLYLGAHYGTDVLAAWAGGGALALLGDAWLNRGTRNALPASA